MDALIRNLPKSVLALAALGLLCLAAKLSGELVSSIRGMDVRLAEVQTQIAVLQATVVTRAEVVQIVREELDREGRK